MCNEKSIVMILLLGMFITVFWREGGLWLGGHLWKLRSEVSCLMVDLKVRNDKVNPSPSRLEGKPRALLRVVSGLVPYFVNWTLL